jgi:hypothetical protein
MAWLHSPIIFPSESISGEVALICITVFSRFVQLLSRIGLDHCGLLSGERGMGKDLGNRILAWMKMRSPILY